jgi:hypothetical protein
MQLQTWKTGRLGRSGPGEPGCAAGSPLGGTTHEAEDVAAPAGQRLPLFGRRFLGFRVFFVSFRSTDQFCECNSFGTTPDYYKVSRNCTVVLRSRIFLCEHLEKAPLVVSQYCGFAVGLAVD